jgi:hypothetical protein
MENNKYILAKDLSKNLIKILKIYANLFKVMHMIDPALASEFKKKQDSYYKEKHKNKEHKHNHKENQVSCCEGKLNNKSKIGL